MHAKRFEVFSGTGGVGKTTLAAARAIDIARQGKRVLLITIDPAKRLRDLLKISEHDAGNIVSTPDPLGIGESLNLCTELMDPSKTFQRLAEIDNNQEVLDNRILKILTRPYGGLNEILAIVELNLQYQTGKFDSIVLDTPPGDHFLDFLDSTQRIKVFFDKSFIEIFNYLGKKIDSSSLGFGKNLMNKIVSSGVRKLLDYLKKVTGDKFVQDFIDAVGAIYQVKTPFINALELQETLKRPEKSNWYLVTSVEQKKLKAALDIKKNAHGLITKDTFVILNKCLHKDIKTWTPESNSQAMALKTSLVDKEESLKGTLFEHFNHILEFPEVLNLSPIEHIKELSQVWKNISYE